MPPPMPAPTSSNSRPFKRRSARHARRRQGRLPDPQHRRGREPARDAQGARTRRCGASAADRALRQARHRVPVDAVRSSEPRICSQAASACKRLKVGSGDLTNAPILLEMAGATCSVILSTGMATMDEIEEALGVLAFGYAGGKRAGRAAFPRRSRAPTGATALRRTSCSCTARPTIRRSPTRSTCGPWIRSRRRSGCRSASPITARASLSRSPRSARGAVMIEKHLTLDRTLAGAGPRRVARAW